MENKTDLTAEEDYEEHFPDETIECINMSLPPPQSASNPYVDKITLELLLNKTHYQKYLSKTDPQKFAEYQEFLENCGRFRIPIIEMTSRLLDNPKRKEYSEEVMEAFQKYSHSLIRYLEIKEMTDAVNEQEKEDDDTMFPASMSQEPENTIKASSSRASIQDYGMNNSFFSRETYQKR